MRILIVGGGIAGLSFAALAKKYNLGQVTLIEKPSTILFKRPIPPALSPSLKLRRSKKASAGTA